MAAVATMRLGRHDLSDLLDLVVVDRAVVRSRPADPRIGALLHHLPELALVGLGHKHTSCVRADIDRGANHRSMIADPTGTPSGVSSGVR
jgi:hypothetical protein